MSFFKPFAAAVVLLAASGAASAQTSDSFALSQQAPSSSNSFAANNPVSEPGSLPLIALGVVGAVAVGRFLKRRKNNKR